MAESYLPGVQCPQQGVQLLPDFALQRGVSETAMWFGTIETAPATCLHGAELQALSMHRHPHSNFGSMCRPAIACTKRWSTGNAADLHL